MKRTENTDQVTISDRQAAGNQPDHSTPTGTIGNGGGGGGAVTQIIAGSGIAVSPGTGVGNVTVSATGGGGTVTSITAGLDLTATPNPITGVGTINHANTGVAGNYQRCTTTARGHVTIGQNDVVNVKQFGADPANTAAANTTAVNAAIAALVNDSTLYFPGSGAYHHNGFTFLSGLSGVRVTGDGAKLIQDTPANNTFGADETCDNCHIDNIWFYGTASSRLNGIHLRWSASNSTVALCIFEGASDYGVYFGAQASASPTQNLQVIGCRSLNNRGDGFHYDYVDGVITSNCIARGNGDDSFAVTGYQSKATQALNLTFTACSAFSGGQRALLLQMAKGVTVTGFVGDTMIAAGIEIGDDGNNAGVFNEDITIHSATLNNCQTTAGPLATLNIFFAKRVSIGHVVISNPSTGYCIALYDFDDVTLHTPELLVTRTGTCYGIFAQGSTSLNGRTARSTWGDLFIKDVKFKTTQTNNGPFINLDPGTGHTIENLMIDDCTGSQAQTGDYIFTNRINTAAKIGNNTCLQTRTISNGGTGATPTLFQNN